MTNYTKLAVRGAATVFIISILAAFLGYVVRFLLARNLTVEEFGLFYAAFAFLGLFGIFKSFGFDKALIKFIPEFEHEGKNQLIKSSIIYVSAILLITNSIIIIAVYLLSNFLAVHFFNNSLASSVLRLMAIAFFIDSFVQILKFSFQGFRKMTYFSGIDLIRMLIILGIILIGLELNYGIKSAIYAYIITPIVLIMIFSPILVKWVFPDFFKSKFTLEKKLLKRISKYSIFVLSISIGGFILGYTDIIILTYFSGLTAVALYSIALPTVRVLIYFARGITGIFIPLTADLWVKGKKELLKSGVEELYKYSIIILVPAVIILFSFADLIINILFGKNYVAAATPMRILSIGMIFHIIYSINVDFFAGIGHPEIFSKIIYSAAIFNLIGNLILIPIMGINGAAITTVASYLIMMIYGMVRIRKFIDINFPWMAWIKTLLTGLIFVSFIGFLKRLLDLNAWIETTIIIIISGLIYIGLLFVMRIIDTEEIIKIYKRIFPK